MLFFENTFQVNFWIAYKTDIDAGIMLAAILPVKAGQAPVNESESEEV